MRKKIENKVENFFLWKWLLGAERTVMVLCSIAVLLTIFAGVICRRVLDINFTSSEELLVIFALWLYFIGGVEGGNYRDDHIKADVLSVFVKKETTIHIVNVVVKIISLVVSVALAVWAWQYFQFCQVVGGKTLVLKLPMMCSRFALVLGYTLPVLYNIYHLILSVCDLADAHGGKTTSAEGGND